MVRRRTLSGIPSKKRPRLEKARAREMTSVSTDPPFFPTSTCPIMCSFDALQ